MSLESVSVHDIRRIELTEPTKLKTGRFVRNLRITTNSGLVTVSMFANNPTHLNVVRT
jgi:hypothetical protein